MSVWNCTTPDERIAMWREFRERILPLSTEAKLNNIATYFADVPVGARSIDYYTPASWPTPWEILYHQLFCQSTISLLMFYTLTVVLPDKDVKIVLIDDDRDRFLVPLVDNKYIFNYILGEISTQHDYSRIRIIDDFSDEFILRIK